MRCPFYNGPSVCSGISPFGSPFHFHPLVNNYIFNDQGFCPHFAIVCRIGKSRLLESALANATNNGKVGTETLIVKNVIINEGMKMKRAAKGRNARTDRGTVVKRTSHLKIVLEEKGVSNGTKN